MLRTIIVCLVLLGFVPDIVAIIFHGSPYMTYQTNSYFQVEVTGCSPVNGALYVFASFQPLSAIIATASSPTPPQFFINTTTWPYGTHNLTMYYQDITNCDMTTIRMKYTVQVQCAWLLNSPYVERQNEISAPGLSNITVWTSACSDGTLGYLSMGDADGFTLVARTERRGDPAWANLNFGTGCGVAPTSMPNLPTSLAFDPPLSCPNTCKVSVVGWPTTLPEGVFPMSFYGFISADNYYIRWMTLTGIVNNQTRNLSRIQSPQKDVSNYFGNVGFSPVYAKNLPIHIADPNLSSRTNCPAVTNCVGASGDCPQNLAPCPATFIGITNCPQTAVGGKCNFQCPLGSNPLSAPYVICKYGGTWSTNGCRTATLSITTSNGVFVQPQGAAVLLNIQSFCARPFTPVIQLQRTYVQTGLTFASRPSLTSTDFITSNATFDLSILAAGLHQFTATYPGDSGCPFHNGSASHYITPSVCYISLVGLGTQTIFEQGSFMQLIGIKCADGIGIQWVAQYNPVPTSQTMLYARDNYIGQDDIINQNFGKCGVRPLLFPTLPIVFSEWHQADSGCPVCMVNVTWTVTTPISGMSGSLSFSGGICADGYYISWNLVVGSSSFLRSSVSPGRVPQYFGSCGVAPTNAPDIPIHIADPNIVFQPSQPGACPTSPGVLTGVVCPFKTIGATGCAAGPLGSRCYYRCPSPSTPIGVGFVTCQANATWSSGDCTATTSLVSTTVTSRQTALCASAGEMIEYVGVLCYENQPYDIRWDGLMDITNINSSCIFHTNNITGLGPWVGSCGVKPQLVYPEVHMNAVDNKEVTFFTSTTTSHAINPSCTDTASSVYVYSGIVCNGLYDVVWTSFTIVGQPTCRQDRATTALAQPTWFGWCGVAPTAFPTLPTRIPSNIYLGCYTAIPNQNPATMFVHDIMPSLTLQQCADYCWVYKFFGVKNGTDCWCGNYYNGPNSEYGPSGDCDTPCAGNSAQRCGGVAALDVYDAQAFLTFSTLPPNATLSVVQAVKRPVPTNLVLLPPPPPQHLPETKDCPLVFEFGQITQEVALPYFPFPYNGVWKIVMDMYFTADGELVSTGPCDSMTRFGGFSLRRISGVLEVQLGIPPQTAQIWNTGLQLPLASDETARVLITFEYNGKTLMASVNGKSITTSSISSGAVMYSEYVWQLMRAPGCLSSTYAGVMRSFKVYSCISCGSVDIPNYQTVIDPCLSQLYPTQCTFHCDYPTQLSGAGTVTCGANGEWSYSGSCDAPQSAWGGAYEVMDQGCTGRVCANTNVLTEACYCPDGYIGSNSIRAISDCLVGLVWGSYMEGCFLATLPSRSDFGGWYETTSSGCISANMYTGACTCPAGATGTTATIQSDTSPGNLIPAQLTFCQFLSNPIVNFGGIYHVRDGTLQCLLSNVRTGACSCPSQTVPIQILRAVLPTPVGSNIYVCTAPKPYTVFLGGYPRQLSLPINPPTIVGISTDEVADIEIVVDAVQYSGAVAFYWNGDLNSVTWKPPTAQRGAPLVDQSQSVPGNVANGNICFAPGFTKITSYNFCVPPTSCHYRRNTNLWEGERGLCVAPCIPGNCPSQTGFNIRGAGSYCDPPGGSTCVNYQPIGGTCGGYVGQTPQAPYCDWTSICLNNGSGWKCANSTCLNTCAYGTYCYTLNTTADTAICGGYTLPTLPGVSTYINSRFFEPGGTQQLTSTQIGQRQCTPGGTECGYSAQCSLDGSVNKYYCVSFGLYHPDILHP